MATIFSRADLDKIKALLDGVTSVGQAQAAIDNTIGMAEKVSSEIGQAFFEDAWRTGARKDIANYVQKLKASAKAMGGDKTMPAGRNWAEDIRPKVMVLWSYAHLVLGQFPPGESSTMERLGKAISSWGDNLSYGVSQAPANIVKGVSATATFAAKTASAVVKPIAQATGEVAGALLGPVKWYLLGAAILVVAGGVAYVYVTKKALPLG